MSDFDNTNTGALFPVKDRKTENHPTHNGTININGADHWLSAWVKVAGEKSKNPGQKFLSLSLGDPLEEQKTAKATPATDDGFDDDIPFN